MNGEVRDQDMYMPASGLRSHGEGIEALFQWLTENWDALIKKCPPGFSQLGTMVTIFTASLAKKEQLQKVEEFFAPKDTAGFEMSLAQSMDSIRSKVSWLERDREDVAKWLKENGYA